MKQPPVRLTKRQREIVRRTILRSCRVKGWELHALCVLSNHVHIVLRAYEQSPEKVMSSLKAWSSRKLNEVYPARSGRKWWTRHGSTRYIKSEASLNQAIEYVRHQ